MKYQDIRTFTERCEHQPAHPAELQLHLHEEISELRHFIEWHIESAMHKAPTINFCPRCGKRTQDIHTCTPPADSWAYPTNNIAP